MNSTCDVNWNEIIQSAVNRLIAAIVPTILAVLGLYGAVAKTTLTSQNELVSVAREANSTRKQSLVELTEGNTTRKALLAVQKLGSQGSRSPTAESEDVGSK